MSQLPVWAQDACQVAGQVRSKNCSAVETLRASLDRIDALDPSLNCFTAVTRDLAFADAEAVDAKVAAGIDPGPLAGVPFAVKNLFDIAGVTTLAGSKIQAENPSATTDASAVASLRAAGAVLVGALNMDEYAYGFTTENTHYGPTRNPHDPKRVAGGSSGGSAAAVAAGMLPLTLGTDTNGSIRVPSAFCGVYGFKPTYGRISRAGAFLFAGSFDHVGPFARTVRDIALAYDVLHGFDPRDPVSVDRPKSPCSPELSKGLDGLRVAVADGYFHDLASPEAFAPVARAGKALGVERTATIPDADAARSAAYTITGCEGASLHLEDLRTRPHDFDPVVIERFLAGALLPASWYLQAQRFRTVYREKVRALFETVDVILAPATPCSAIEIGQPTITVNGTALPSRPNIGVFTQPLSFIGLPIICVPVFVEGELPMGVQVVGAPHNEAAVLRVAAALEAAGVARSPVPTLQAVS